MHDERRAQREVINYYLKVYDRDSGDFLGYLADVTQEGAMIQSREPIEPDSVFHLRMELGEDLSGEEITIDARSVWDKKERNSIFYSTGFRFEGVPEEARPKLEKLMESYRLEGHWKSGGDQVRH